MSSSCRAVSKLPLLFVLVPILLMLIDSVQPQTVNGTSLLAALIINKIENCIDKLNAIGDFVGLFASLGT